METRTAPQLSACSTTTIRYEENVRNDFFDHAGIKVSNFLSFFIINLQWIWEEMPKSYVRVISYQILTGFPLMIFLHSDIQPLTNICQAEPTVCHVTDLVAHVDNMMTRVVGCDVVRC